jgi:hypothetical protein
LYNTTMREHFLAMVAQIDLLVAHDLADSASTVAQRGGRTGGARPPPTSARVEFR